MTQQPWATFSRSVERTPDVVLILDAVLVQLWHLQWEVQTPFTDNSSVAVVAEARQGRGHGRQAGVTVSGVLELWKIYRRSWVCGARRDGAASAVHGKALHTAVSLVSMVIMFCHAAVGYPTYLRSQRRREPRQNGKPSRAFC